MPQKPVLIAVVGTNASGKSGLGVELAERYHGEIISADSRQVFRRLDLGSGKIAAHEMRGVKHHLIDVCEPGDFFSMADFQCLAYEAIDGAIQRGALPFLVGGTGLYVSSVTEGYVLSGVQPDLEYRKELEKQETPALYAMLQNLLPGTDIDGNNRNRVMRALEKLHDGDTQTVQNQPRYRTLKLGVSWDRTTLCARIDERLKRRMDEGMLQEVQSLLDAGVSKEFLDKLGLEYRYLSRYLTGEIQNRDEMLSELALAIKRFAKRQMTWFRRDRDVLWLDMHADPVAQACREIDAFLAVNRP